MGRIRDWYRRQPRWVLWLNIMSFMVFLLVLVHLWKKSEPEVRAILWHYRHGDHVTINGVTFNVYYWWAPTDDYKNMFVVDDRPGPLRPTDEEEYTTIEIWGVPEEQGTPHQIIEKELAGYKKAGYYHDLRTFQQNVRSQQLECIDKTSKYGSRTLNCFGDGPIYYIFFGGSEESRARFDRMLTEAR